MGLDIVTITASAKAAGWSIVAQTFDAIYWQNGTRKVSWSLLPDGSIDQTAEWLPIGTMTASAQSGGWTVTSREGNRIFWSKGEKRVVWFLDDAGNFNLARTLPSVQAPASSLLSSLADNNNTYPNTVTQNSATISTSLKTTGGTSSTLFTPLNIGLGAAIVLLVIIKLRRKKQK